MLGWPGTYKHTLSPKVKSRLVAQRAEIGPCKHKAIPDPGVNWAWWFQPVTSTFSLSLIPSTHIKKNGAELGR